MITLDNQSQRLAIIYLLEKEQLHETGTQLIRGLSQQPKRISPRYFYDDQGSALFEQICALPEYYPTRTEAFILKKFAPEIAMFTGNCELIELGSGSSTKTRFLLDAYQKFGSLDYVPVDVSAGILESSAKKLLNDYNNLTVQGLIATYSQAIAHLPESALLPRMLIFLGSTLGNFSPRESDRFFGQARRSLKIGDYFLLGVDRQKSASVLEAAYNDAQGITAAFNLNMLAHLNRRYGANFDLDSFTHRAIYNTSLHQIEMYLDCQQSHTVYFSQLEATITLEQGESILTEISRKFDLEQLQTYLKDQGFKTIQTWSDPQDWFSLILTQAV